MTDDDDIYDSLPEDPEQTFLALEEHFREKCLKATSQSGDDPQTSPFWLEYIYDVLAGAKALELKADLGYSNLSSYLLPLESASNRRVLLMQIRRSRMI
jgi:hypothetical protein